MSEPDLYTDHVANLFSEPEEAAPTEAIGQEADSGPETAAPAATGDAATSAPSSAQEGEPAVETDSPLDWARIAQARLREINSLRSRQSAMRERTDKLEREFAEWRKKMGPSDELPEELLEADPALKYVTGKLKGIEQQLYDSRQAQTESANFNREVTETVRYAQESRQAFVQHTPDWDQAYQFVRQKFAEANGKVGAPDRDEWLNVQEHMAVGQWRQDGEDPALKIYEMAVAGGWRPGAKGAQPPPVAAAPSNGSPRIRRVRDAVAAPSPSSIGKRDMGSDIISREQFYEQYPQSERIRIFNSDRGEDIFESLMKEGRVPASMLPRST